MLERSKRMTRTEHRDANHLEDDGGIREIIQSAQIMPISDAEKGASGQMALLEEPQELWDRPGCRQFSGFSKKMNSESTSKKRKLDSVSLDGAADTEDQPPLKAVRHTVAFVDCRNSEPSDRQSYEDMEEDDSDDEPIIHRFRPEPVTTPTKPPAHPSLHARSEDPYMPSMGHPLPEDGHNSEHPAPVIDTSSDQQQSTLNQDFRRVSNLSTVER